MGELCATPKNKKRRHDDMNSIESTVTVSRFWGSPSSNGSISSVDKSPQQSPSNSKDRKGSFDTMGQNSEYSPMRTLLASTFNGLDMRSPSKKQKFEREPALELRANIIKSLTSLLTTKHDELDEYRALTQLLMRYPNKDDFSTIVPVIIVELSKLNIAGNALNTVVHNIIESALVPDPQYDDILFCAEVFTDDEFSTEVSSIKDLPTDIYKQNKVLEQKLTSAHHYLLNIAWKLNDTLVQDEQLTNQELFLPIINCEHIFTGTDNTGFHHENRETPSPVYTVGKNGDNKVYAGHWRPARKKSPKFSSFFPYHWSPSQVCEAIRNAFLNNVIASAKHKNGIEKQLILGRGTNNVFIEMHAINNVIVDAYPLSYFINFPVTEDYRWETEIFEHTYTYNEILDAVKEAISHNRNSIRYELGGDYGHEEFIIDIAQTSIVQDKASFQGREKGIYIRINEHFLPMLYIQLIAKHMSYTNIMKQRQIKLGLPPRFNLASAFYNDDDEEPSPFQSMDQLLKKKRDDKK